MPEQVLIRKAVGITIPVYEEALEGAYILIRQCASDMKDDRNYYEQDCTNSSRSMGVVGMYQLGKEEVYMHGHSYRNAVTVTVRHNRLRDKPNWMFKNEVVLAMRTEDDIPCSLRYEVAYAVVSKTDGKGGRTLISIAFYNSKDELVITLRQYREQMYGSIRCKAGKYILDADVYKEKEKKQVAGGCFFCDNAHYVKENGIIYIACNKYDGRVAEVEYTGEAYPEYCKRRV